MTSYDLQQAPFCARILRQNQDGFGGFLSRSECRVFPDSVEKVLIARFLKNFSLYRRNRRFQLREVGQFAEKSVQRDHIAPGQRSVTELYNTGSFAEIFEF